MKTNVDRSDKIYTILICFCLLVIACVETLTSGILKKTEANTPVMTQTDLSGK